MWEGKIKKKETKKGKTGTKYLLQNKFVLILVTYYAFKYKWPRRVTDTCLVEEKKQMIQNKTYAMSCTRWLWIKNRTATDFNTLYYTEQNNCTKSIHRQQNIFSHVQDQTIDLFVQKTKRQENYQCLNNPDSWKIQQILAAKVIGKISEPLKSVDKSKKNLFFLSMDKLF